MTDFFKLKSKGQVFLIIGIFVLLALIMLKTETSQTTKQAFYAIMDWKSSFENIGSEYQKTADISLAQETAAGGLERNMNNFSNFSIDLFSQRDYAMQIFYSFAFVNSSNITVAVGNFYSIGAKNISVNMSSGHSAFFSSIPYRQSNSSMFPPAGNFNVTINYFVNETFGNFTYYGNGNLTASFYIALRLQQANSVADDRIIFNKTAG